VNTYASLRSGTLVQASDGTPIGAVERVVPPVGDSPEQATQLVIRSPDGQRSYSIPLPLVRDVAGDSIPPVVRLSVAPEQLARYEAVLMAGSGTPQPNADLLRIPLLAEELLATAQPIVRGTVRIHKGVATEQQSVTVPISYEVAVVERIPAGAYDASAPPNPDEIIVPVLEEQIVIEKRQVIKEYLRVRKTMVGEERLVTDTVRREYVEVTEHRVNGTDPAVAVPLVQHPPR
jgi:uncharacterized protein (TIGR02271 family)